MAITPLSAFTQTATAFFSAGPTTSNVVIPTTGSPTMMLVTNTSEAVVYVVFGTSNAVVATQATGLAIEPHATTVPLVIGSNTYMAAITNFAMAGLNIAVGT